MKGKLKKKKWVRPVLRVLVRDDAVGSVLSNCKAAGGGGPLSGWSNCWSGGWGAYVDECNLGLLHCMPGQEGCVTDKDIRWTPGGPWYSGCMCSCNAMAGS